MENYEKEHLEMLRREGAGCALYLKRGGDLPLDAPCALALYGSGARHTLKGGTGSGDVNVRGFATIEQSLREAGFTITTGAWLDGYDAVREQARTAFISGIRARAKAKHTTALIEGMGAVMPEPEYRLPPEGTGDTAVYVLSRVSGEGNDRGAVPGDILLSETETRDILELDKKYRKFLLVLNVGGVVDLSPVADIGNILYLGQLGTETGHILADILLGKSYPSGKLTTTWSAWADHPDIGEFGDIDETRYKEGVYVGYRYFDTVGRRPLFPFGFGLGNTDFNIRAGEITARGERVSVSAAVTNTGNRAGREVAQLYVSSPAGTIDKPFQALAAFAKTKELRPGETEELSLCFDLRTLAVYDESRAAWVLEKGDYILRLGSSSADTEAIGGVRLGSDALTRQCRSCCGRPGHDDWKPPARDAEEPELRAVIAVSAADIHAETVSYDTARPIDPVVESLTDSELAYMSTGAFSPGALSIIGNASRSVAGAAGETWGALREKGIPPVVMADGPAGLRLSRDYTLDKNGAHAVGTAFPDDTAELLPGIVRWFMKKTGPRIGPETEIRHQYCTAIPIGTCLAQSWDTAFAEACGDLIGDEMERFGVHLWLAPALNIHRDIRCGRNFEYYSEDPLISGVFAAAITRGIQKHPGRGAVIKHYAANNQETNRYGSNSRISERALREIYLRGFGIAVSEGGPAAVMTSYNLLNGAHTSERRDLIEDILRCEFGFDGVVMTDWIVPGMQMKGTVYGRPDAGKIAAAGNDLTMPGSRADHRSILRALADGTLSREQLRINVSRIVRLAKRSAGRNALL